MSNLQKKHKSVQICEEQRSPNHCFSYNLEQFESLSVMKNGESTVHDYLDEKLVESSPSLKTMTSPELLAEYKLEKSDNPERDSMTLKEKKSLP